jgi:hypothetical protein
VSLIHGHAVPLQLHALAYNLANIPRTLALPEAAVADVPPRGRRQHRSYVILRESSLLEAVFTVIFGRCGWVAWQGSVWLVVAGAAGVAFCPEV